MRRILRSTFLTACSLIVAAGLSAPALAQLENENLLLSMPPGYKVDFQKKQGSASITEMVPNAETVQNWTEMVTVQVFYNMKTVTPQEFKGRLEQLWASSCPKASSKSVAEGVEHGYPTLMWVLFCPLNPSTGKPENTWLKAIQGRDSFYLVQKAYKFTPTKAQEAQWVDYLNSASVCDTRGTRSPCPKTKP